jgi:hypothetical protein
MLSELPGALRRRPPSAGDLPLSQAVGHLLSALAAVLPPSAPPAAAPPMRTSTGGGGGGGSLLRRSSNGAPRPSPSPARGGGAGVVDAYSEALLRQLLWLRFGDVVSVRKLLRHLERLREAHAVGAASAPLRGRKGSAGAGGRCESRGKT